MPAGHPTLYLPKYCEMLIKWMGEGLSFPSFAGHVGVCVDTVYEWAKVHPEFSEAKKIGKAMELAFWEKLLRSGAAGKLQHFSATATIFALKNKAPQYYRDKIQVDSNVTVDETKSSLKKLLDNPKYSEAAMVIAEALAEEKTNAENNEGE